MPQRLNVSESYGCSGHPPRRRSEIRFHAGQWAIQTRTDDEDEDGIRSGSLALAVGLAGFEPTTP